MTNPDKPKVRKNEHGWYVTHRDDHLRVPSWPLAMMVAAVRVGVEYRELVWLGHHCRRFVNGQPVTTSQPW